MVLKYVLNIYYFIGKAGSGPTVTRKYACVMFSVVELKLSGIIYSLYDQGYLLTSANTHTPENQHRSRMWFMTWNGFASEREWA